MDAIDQKRYLRLAIPFALSTVTQPLLGAVDAAVVGRLGSPAFIGGVAIGTVIFNTLYWLFGFLRVATSGFAAQTLGKNRPREIVGAWLRPLCLAVALGLLFILCQLPILRAAMMIYRDADPEVTGHAATYFRILIWGAPCVLVNYASLGWLMGRGHVREVVYLQIGTNILNILLDLFFVLVLRLAVPGVAAATLIAQSYACFFGLYLVLRRLPWSLVRTHCATIWDAGILKKQLMVNGDFFIRTCCLLTMTNIFVARGSSMGTEILAANAILFQLQYLMACLFDGLANAVAVFAGKFVGSRDLPTFCKIRDIVLLDMIVLGLVLLVVLLFFHGPLFCCFTDLAPVLALCRQYLWYLVLFVPTMGPGLVWYGFFVGATHTAPIRNSLLAALALFIALETLLIPGLHNYGLWIAFIAFCSVRTLYLVLSWRSMIRQSFPENPRVPEPGP